MAASEVKNLYENEVYQEFLDRIDNINHDTKPLWGKMNAAQMFTHCAEIQEVCNGKPLDDTPWFFKLFKGIIKNILVNDKPFKKNMPTHPQYLVTNQKDFKQSKQRFLDALEKFKKDETKNIPHPLFGDMTSVERGRAMYKHHAHHLTQFGV